MDCCEHGNEPPSSIKCGNVACFLPGRAKDLSASPVDMRCACQCVADNLLSSPQPSTSSMVTKFTATVKNRMLSAGIVCVCVCVWKTFR